LFYIQLKHRKFAVLFFCSKTEWGSKTRGITVRDGSSGKTTPTALFKTSTTPQFFAKITIDAPLHAKT
jgi:hypothetical protein